MHNNTHTYPHNHKLQTFEQYKKDMERSNMQRTQLLLDYESLKAKHNSSESQVCVEYAS
jgi:hypothetical protein